MSIKFTMVYLLGAIGGAVMTLTPELLTAVGALLVAVITAIGAVVVNILTARKVDKVKELAQANLAETQVVKGHVNSAATAAAAEIKGLRDELALMRTVAADKKETAALLAQSVATAPQGISPSAGTSLENIDKNTDQIEKNTSKTKSDIEDIKTKTYLDAKG